MMRGPSHYDLLGVSPHATSEEVRAAYLRLIKRHHPDVHGRGEDGGEARADAALQINQSYEVLRDPERRAAYDAQIAREQAAFHRPTRIAARAATPVPADRTGARTGALALIFIVALMLVQPWRDRRPAQWLDSVRAMSDPSADAAALKFGASRSAVRRAALAATSASPSEAEATSARCFAALRQVRSAAAEDLCIVYDDAYIYWHRNARGDWSLPSYFDDTVVRIRHLNALAGSGRDADERLPALRDLTFRTLLDQLSAGARASEARARVTPPRPSRIGT